MNGSVRGLGLTILKAPPDRPGKGWGRMNQMTNGTAGMDRARSTLLLADRKAETLALAVERLEAVYANIRKPEPQDFYVPTALDETWCRALGLNGRTTPPKSSTAPVGRLLTQRWRSPFEIRESMLCAWTQKFCRQFNWRNGRAHLLRGYGAKPTLGG